MPLDAIEDAVGHGLRPPWTDGFVTACTDGHIRAYRLTDGSPNPA